MGEQGNGMAQATVLFSAAAAPWIWTSMPSVAQLAMSLGALAAGVASLLPALTTFLDARQARLERRAMHRARIHSGR